ncbi:MAG: phosphate acyltransferase PlsX [Planctomycetota bacterium]|nr:MAG: phosphate acyltransferase PlsX [Planctomycetota bacterium]REJ95969.1 MAG: phosphate acyltransferase PlsX [Planctomycetota bacterium]REK21524.1 MAG: phosphate acyltransferase PlsX [Planctomycetota bacterium]REK39921.1 MAG: phosphate acyltransferase PlsX [Planctomycetota bacterium]
MRIALDAMGGDLAPKINIEGAIAAVQAHPDLEVVLVGDRAAIDAQLEEAGASEERISIAEADGHVGMHEKPTEAMRKKPNCSIAVCWRLMAGREVEAVVSAGNTGGVVAMGLRTRLFLKGVKRPGIAVVLPTLTGRALLLDVGANPAARPEHLYQYAVMGSIYAREMLKVEEPKLGLMNIGSEEGKGTDLVRETHELIVGSSLKPHYIGNVEGRGLYQGEADVIVCEGFVGNVVLKVSEGMAGMMLSSIAREVLGSVEKERAQVESTFRDITRRFEYNEVGGAPLLGIDGICLICHGSSDARSIANALRGAGTLHDHRVNSRIVEELGANGSV